MKRIYFDNFSHWKNGVLIAVALVCILIGLWYLDSSIWYRRMNALGFFLMVIVLGKRFTRKYYVGWNKLAIVIKLRSILGKDIRFRDIAAIERSADSLMIKKRDGNILRFAIAEINTTDIDRLIEILTKYTEATIGRNALTEAGRNTMKPYN